MLSRFIAWIRGFRPERVHDAVVLSLIVVAIVAGVFAMSGCAAPVREQVFDESGPTTEQVWHGTSSTSTLLEDAVGWNPGGSAGTAAWTRSPETELSALFPELRNPRISVYVFPHLTPAGHPVPGYTTNFHLYESSRNYALPGEAYRQGILK